MPERTQHHRPDDRLDGAQTPVTVAQAAQLLGLSAEAVRSRVQRGTLASTKVDGTVYVLLDSNQVRPNAHLSGDQSGDEDRPNAHLSGDQTEIVASLQEQVDWLRREVERKDTLLMTLMQRIPELESPPEPRDSPQTGAEVFHGTHDAPPTPEHPIYGTSRQEAEESLQRRSSWWRRFFGFE